MSWFNTSSTIPQWKTFIIKFQQQKTKSNITTQNISFTLQPHTLPIINIPQFLSNISLILNEIKSYNNEITDFVKSYLPLLIKQSVRIILQIPKQNQSQQRKNKFPLQGLQFIQGLVYLPNIFNINFLSEEFYNFYCKCIIYYGKINFENIAKLKSNENYQNSLYKNYFYRLFEIPYIVTQCETRIGANYSSISMSVASSIMPKRQTFLESLIGFLDKNHASLDMFISNIQNESMVNCLSKILMTNGMHNYPFHLKEYILKKCFQVKKKYIQMLSNLLNSKVKENQIQKQKQELQLKMENILQLEFNIVNRSANIYDGIKLFEFIGNMENVNNLIYMTSINIVSLNRNPSGKSLVPLFLEEHLTQVLLSIVHKDTTLYKNSGSSVQVQPKVSLKQINQAIQPLILSLKELISQKSLRPQTKHLNMMKILYVMILNRQKYDILENLIIKQNILSVVIQICKKHFKVDILVNTTMEIFKSIFKSEVNLPILAPNIPNLQQIKNKNDMVEQKITAEAFKAGDLILTIIKTMKSHKDPLFGQFFKLAKIVKEFGRNFFSTIDCSMDLSLSSSTQIQSSTSINLLLEPIYKNEYIKGKSKQWIQFYKTNFAQLQTNYQRDLGKFEQFQKAPQPAQTQYKVTRFCQQKSITNSQIIHDKTEFEASMKNSIQILSLDKQKAGQNNLNIQKSNEPAMNFKKEKNSESKKPQIPHLLTKQQIQITSEPIKIQFKKKKVETVQQNQQTNQQSASQDGQHSFKKFMQKRMNEINNQNRQNVRKKSKTPTKFRSADDKTPPKMKKWGSTKPEQNVTPNLSKLQDPQLQKSSKSMPPQPTLSLNLSADSKLQKLKEKLLTSKPQPITIIKVGKNVPKVYKQRLVEFNGKDSRLMQWIRA